MHYFVETDNRYFLSDTPNRQKTFGHGTSSSRAVIWICILALPILTVCAPVPALAATTGGGASMPWETPLQTIADSITGPVAKAIGVIAIAVTGLGFAFSEGGSVLRRGIGIVFGLAIAFTASTFLTSFFSVTSGAVFQ